MARPRPAPPRPEILRRAREAFGWLEARWLHEGWLGRLGPQATSVVVLLALAADSHGASYYGRHRMAQRLWLTREDIDEALARLLQQGLVAHRPWRTGDVDGVWQLLPLPSPPSPEAPEERLGSASVGALLAQLGFTPQQR